MKLIIATIVALFLIRCNEMKSNKLAISKLESSSEVYIDPEGKKSHKIDVFLIENPPLDLNNLLSVVQEYNDSTMADTNWKKYKSYFRYFFRETDELTKDFKPVDKGYFDKDNIGNYYNDCLVKIEWNTDETDVIYPIYNFYTNGHLNKIYYPKGRKNFNNIPNEWVSITVK